MKTESFRLTALVSSTSTTALPLSITLFAVSVRCGPLLTRILYCWYVFLCIRFLDINLEQSHIVTFWGHTRRSMRVLDTESGQFVQINHLGAEYAILSHTWDHENGEQTYAQLKRIQERYVSGSSARPSEDIPHPQDNPSSTTTPPDRHSSALGLTGNN